MPEPFRIPIVDIAAYYSGVLQEKKAIAAQIGDACKKTGFLVITGHQITPDALENVRDVSRRYFDLPLEQKLLAASGASLRGYTPEAGERLGNLASDGKRATPDTKELFDSGDHRVPMHEVPLDMRDHYKPNNWNGTLPEMRTAFERYFESAESLAGDLMSLLALALELPERFFTRFIGGHRTISGMRVINYPERDFAAAGVETRGGAHTDYTTISIVAIDDTPGGLQVLTPTGQWLDVPFVPRSLVVNLGDLMARWTNDLWVSTVHRVAVPPPNTKQSTRRLSVIFFHAPHAEAVIEVLPHCSRPGEPSRYAPIRYLDFLHERVAAQKGLSTAANEKKS